MRIRANTLTGAIVLIAALFAGSTASNAQTPTPRPLCPFQVGTPSLPNLFATGNEAPGQQVANCIAWQQFIYLNWQAKPGGVVPDTSVRLSQFGVQPLAQPPVWQTYLPATTVMSGNVSGPGNTGNRPPLVLQAINKYGFSGINQASGAVWLTSQAGNLTYYDVRMNPNEVDFVQRALPGQPLNGMAAQFNCATLAPSGSQAGFRLPMGYGNDTDCLGNRMVFGDGTGTIELKAAWLILPPNDPNKSRYLTAQAQVTDPNGVTSTQTVGLVGLHIIRRMPGASQMVWSTFEQIDNSPNYNLTTRLASDPRPATGAPRNARSSYTYFNPTCTEANDPVYKCQVNIAPTAACTAPNTPAGCAPYNAPQQIGRTTPLENYANAVNAWVWRQLPQASVFQYYRLIDVQWPTFPKPPQLTAGQLVPLAQNNQPPIPNNMVPNLVSLAPNTRVIANTTMETYAQRGSPAAQGGPATCMDCHAFANIAARATDQQHGAALQRAIRRPPPLQPKDYLSSYSFIFSQQTVLP